MITAGFREVDEKDVERERALRRVAEECVVSLVGPNSLGIVTRGPA